jgi:hypothetical protein
LALPTGELLPSRLGAALAELHTEAGWCRYDSGLDGTGHFTRALQLAAEAKDAYGIANAAFVAAWTLSTPHHD